MLKKLLSLIQKNGTISPADLGRQLGLDPHLVVAMLDDLNRRGLLKSVGLNSTCQSSSCGGCPLAANCQSDKPRVWEISS
jgi:DNA-binding Lrp family transcriptional regulator